MEQSCPISLAASRRPLRPPLDDYAGYTRSKKQLTASEAR
jgi:hypothetical protein